MPDSDYRMVVSVNSVWLQLFDYALPLASHTFDAILCFESVEHFSYPERLVRELGRVTKPGGTSGS